MLRIRKRSNRSFDLLFEWISIMGKIERVQKFCERIHRIKIRVKNLAHYKHVFSTGQAVQYPRVERSGFQERFNRNFLVRTMYISIRDARSMHEGLGAKLFVETGLVAA